MIIATCSEQSQISRDRNKPVNREMFYGVKRYSLFEKRDNMHISAELLRNTYNISHNILSIETTLLTALTKS